MSLAILSMGTALPPTRLSQADTLRVARTLGSLQTDDSPWLESVYAGTGIRDRYIALGDAVVQDLLGGTRHSGSVFLPTGGPDDRGPTTEQRMRHYAELAPPLALRASEEALGRSGLGPAEVTHLVTVSCTGFVAPGIDRALLVGLGLPATVERTHVGFMGCHGALNGLRVAGAFTGSDPAARVLLCCVELCSLHYHYQNNVGTLIANALFADGAAAVVGAPAERAPGAAWRLAATGSCLLPDSAAAMTWTVGDHGFEMTLGRHVPALIGRCLRPWLEAWLGRHGLTVEQVAAWAVHPGGPRILQAVEESLALPRAATAAARAVFADCGNMSSPTILFILDRLRREDAGRPCVALGFGPGLVAEAALFL
jgi:predicted naringenin-chalcone synthase